jgi:hypothetical protein
VNKRQKILTLIFLLLFVITLFVCPFECRASMPSKRELDAGAVNIYSPGVTMYQPFFKHSVCIIAWQRLGLEWVALAVIYIGLRSVLK